MKLIGFKPVFSNFSKRPLFACQCRILAAFKPSRSSCCSLFWKPWQKFESYTFVQNSIRFHQHRPPFSLTKPGRLSGKISVKFENYKRNRPRSFLICLKAKDEAAHDNLSCFPRMRSKRENKCHIFVDIINSINGVQKRETSSFRTL